MATAPVASLAGSLGRWSYSRAAWTPEGACSAWGRRGQQLRKKDVLILLAVGPQRLPQARWYPQEFASRGMSMRWERGYTEKKKMKEKKKKQDRPS